MGNYDLWGILKLNSVIIIITEKIKPYIIIIFTAMTMILIDIFSGPIFLQIGWLWVQILLRRDKTAGASAERACGHLVRCWGGISVLRGRRLLQSRVVRQLPGGGRDRWVCQGGWGLHLPGRLQRQATTTLWQVRLNKFWIKRKMFLFQDFSTHNVTPMRMASLDTLLLWSDTALTREL